MPPLELDEMKKAAAQRKKVMANLPIIACQVRWDGTNYRESKSAGSKGQSQQVLGEWEWCP